MTNTRNSNKDTCHKYNNIPSEIILSILSQLDSSQDLLCCAQVCQLWSYFAIELLWYKPNLDSQKDPSTWNSFFSIIQAKTTTFPYASFIRRINLSPLSSMIEDLHVMALRYCKRLERLTLAGCFKLTDIGLCTLIDEIGAMLISIDLSDVNQITDKTIFKTASCCPNLQGINLSMSRPQTGITDSSMTALARQCVHLKRVKLSKCINITSKSVTSLSQYCSRLFEIDLTNCNIDDLVLISIFDYSQELRELRLGQPDIAETRITERAFIDANITQENCYQQLRFVDLTNISSINDQSISTLVHAAPRIRSLVLNKCPQITDEGALSIAKLGRFLRFLHLGHCSRLTDRSMAPLTMECNRIRYLDLACCTQVTDVSIIQIAKNLSKLKRIGLAKCGNLTDLSLEALVHYHAANYNCLERIHLSYCIQLSTRGVAKLLNVCHQLNHLSLTNVPAFLREDLQAYCRTSPKELTGTQRRAFCVYSGKNIQDLSNYLNLLYSHDMTVLFPLQYPLEIMQEENIT